MHPAPCVEESSTFFYKKTHFSLFYKTPLISFPAYGPGPDYRAIQGDGYDKMRNVSIHSCDV